jgi:hypothetical protein
MSANGVALFALLAIASVLFPSAAVVPGFALALAILFVTSRGAGGLVALKRAILISAPVAAFLAIVWIGVVGRAPDATIFYRPAGPVGAWTGVAAVGARLFLVALFTFAAVETGARIRPSFLGGLAVPRPFKIVLLAAASLADVMRQGSQRAHTALVAANVLTGRPSLRNLSSGWLLLRTTWVAALGIADERLSSKWLHEDLPEAAPLGGRRPLTGRDLAWLAAALASFAAAAAVRGG